MNEFGNAIADMLYSRMDDGEFLQRLQDSPAYAQAQQEYQTAYKVLAGDQGLAPSSQEQTLIDALRHIHDLELQYIYRAGLQDGINLKDPAFLTAGL